MSHFREPALSSVRQMWLRFCDSGDSGYLRDLPPYIAESWQRSREHGIDPGLARFPLSEEGDRWNAEEQSLLGLVLPALKPFERDLRECSALLTVTGKAGRIIHRDGNRRVLAAADGINAVPGAVPRENTVGTNSLGTTLHLGSAVGISRWQHFCEAFWEWSDVGAPVCHPTTGEVIGAIDLGLYKQPLSPALSLAVKAMVGRIQAAILERDAGVERTLMTRWAGSQHGHDSALLAVDRYGRILTATPGAGRLLAPDGSALGGRPLGDFPALAQLAASHADPRTQVVQLGNAQGETAVSIEPMVVDGQQAGAVIRLEVPRRRAAKGESEWRSRFAFEQLIGTSRGFAAARALAHRAARTELPILLSGETGTGKELFAHAIHAASVRASGPFVTVNCGAIPAELVTSELFGYEKGAFTGASSVGRRGKFEQADGGTLFLDEITESGPAVQVSLLRVLEDGEVIPVGAEKGRRIDVRIVAATNRDPAQAIADGVLRKDLYYRLKGASIALPPLRERTEDLAELVTHFCGASGRNAVVSPAAMDLLMTYRWPGNLRELGSVIRSAIALADSAVIGPEDLPVELRSSAAPASGARAQPRGFDIEAAERDTIERAMDQAKGNVKEAARLLGIGRSSLYRKLHRWQLRRTSQWRDDR